jgi:hypothetical protein
MKNYQKNFALLLTSLFLLSIILLVAPNKRNVVFLGPQTDTGIVKPDTTSFATNFSDTTQVKLAKNNYTPKVDSSSSILFIGDSHTTYAKGWQYQLAKLANLKSHVISKGGMRTDWMWRNSRSVISHKFSYCFIWGGANDAASEHYNLDTSISHIQKIVNLCNKHGVKVFVLTGFNPTNIRITDKNRKQWGFYPAKYVRLQNLMKSKITGATVIQNWFISRDCGDCGDFICHMTASGHRKMAQGIYQAAFDNN